MTGARRALGDHGEERVAQWYLANGYKIVARNWRGGRTGEIDIVASKSGTIVFCEVKTRSSNKFGSPVEAITWAKQRRIRQLASMYLAAHPARAQQVRFDAGSVMGEVIEVLEGVI